MRTSFRRLHRALPAVACALLAMVAVAGAGGASVGRAAVPAAQAATAPPVITQWGIQGTGPRQFDQPYGIDVSASGEVYVTDNGNARVQQFTSSGDYVTQWGRPGSRDGEFGGPKGIAVGPAGNVYVVDGGNYRVQWFTAGGLFQGAWGTAGPAEGRLEDPRAIACDSAAGLVYVADSGDQSVKKYMPAGAFVSAWTPEVSGAGEITDLKGLAVDSLTGWVYTTDAARARVSVFDSNGRELYRWGSLGSGDGEFNNPTAVAVDRRGLVYVCDIGNSRIQVFQPDGSFVTKWTVGKAALSGIAVDRSFNVYVVDNRNHWVRKYGPITLPPDKTPPTTTILGADDKWHNSDVTLTLTAKDAPGGLGGVARTEYRVQVQNLPPPLPPEWSDWLEAPKVFKVLALGDHSRDGAHRYQFRSIDVAGNPEPPISVTVRIDTTPPKLTVLPLASPQVKKGAKVEVRMRVVEQLSEKVRLRIGIYDDAADKIVFTKTSGWVKTPRTRPTSYQFVCRLTRGAYHIVAEATDLAGNTGEPDSTSLVVK